MKIIFVLVLAIISHYSYSQFDHEPNVAKSQNGDTMAYQILDDDADQFPSLIVGVGGGVPIRVPEFSICIQPSVEYRFKNKASISGRLIKPIQVSDAVLNMDVYSMTAYMPIFSNKTMDSEVIQFGDDIRISGVEVSRRLNVLMSGGFTSETFNMNQEFEVIEGFSDYVLFTSDEQHFFNYKIGIAREIVKSYKLKAKGKVENKQGYSRMGLEVLLNMKSSLTTTNDLSRSNLSLPESEFNLKKIGLMFMYESMTNTKNTKFATGIGFRAGVVPYYQFEQIYEPTYGAHFEFYYSINLMH